jgi:hypothetical protein
MSEDTNVQAGLLSIKTAQAINGDAIALTPFAVGPSQSGHSRSIRTSCEVHPDRRQKSSNLLESPRMPAAADTRSRRSCSGWCQPPPSAVPARLRAGLVTGIPAATRLLVVARLQPAPSDARTCSMNPGIDDPSIPPTRAIENHSEATNHLPIIPQFIPTNFTSQESIRLNRTTNKP